MIQLVVQVELIMIQNTTKIYANRFAIQKKLSSGSFGIVFLVIDNRTNTKFALKAEKEENSIAQSVEREIQMLIQLTGVQGVPKLLWEGRDGHQRILVMELLGKDLGYYFKTQKKFTLKCCLQLMYDLIEILKNIHKKFIVHRDLKPENLMMSIELDQIYIVDFGISKVFFESDHIPFRTDKDFVGTTRYASIAAHKGHEIGRKDDLESLFYVIMFFLRGSLPWQNLPIDDQERNRIVGEMKQTISADELTNQKELILILQYIKSLKFEDVPNYDYVQELLIKCSEQNTLQLDGYYDWNEGMKFSKKLSDSNALSRKEILSPKIKNSSTSKISNQIIWSIQDNSINQSQKNLLVPPLDGNKKTSRGEIRHLSSSSYISVMMDSYNTLRPNYAHSKIEIKNKLRKMVSIEFINNNDESKFQEIMDENYQDIPLATKINNYRIIQLSQLNKFKEQ